MANGIQGLLGNLRGAGQKIQGLLSNPTVQSGLLAAASGFNPLLGLIAGPGIKNDRERNQLENQAAREALSQRSRQTKAQEQLQGLLSGGAPPDQNQLLGLLSQASPDAFNQSLTTGLLGQMFPDQQNERAETSLVRNARVAFGLGPDDPVTPEFSSFVRQQMESGGAEDDLLARVQLQLNTMQLEDARREREQSRRTASQNRRTAETSLGTTLDHVKEAAELNSRLAPTFLASGASGQDIRRTLSQGVNDVKALFGVDTAKSKQLIADYDRFQKLNSKFIIESMSGIGGEGLGTVTNDKLSLLMKSMAGSGISPGANNLIYADTIQSLMDIAEIEGFDIKGIEEFGSLEQRLRNPTSEDTVDLGGGVTLEFVD